MFVLILCFYISLYVLIFREVNPEVRYPVLKDPALVRAGKLACVGLLNTLPPHNKTDYVVKMYSLIEMKFNSLVRERIVR